MAVIRSFLGLLVLLELTEARVVRRASGDVAHNDVGNLTVSELLERANSHLSRNRNGLLIEGDIIRSSQRNADSCVQKGCKWPKSADGKVYIPYVISAQYSPQDKTLIRRAFDSFSSSTCIRFISRTNQKDYIHIKSLQGCYSYVGRQGKEQIVSLNRPGCMYHGTVQHELLHSLGFHHEHSRSDRDKHIRILLKNVTPGHQHNFLKRNTLNQGTPYDYGSVMHYGRLFFSKDNKSPTLEAFPNPKAVFGTAKQMSQNDIKRVNLLYCTK